MRTRASSSTTTPAQLADAVRQISESRERWREFSDAGLEAALTAHSHDEYGRRYEAIYEDVVDSVASSSRSAAMTSS